MDSEPGGSNVREWVLETGNMWACNGERILAVVRLCTEVLDVVGCKAGVELVSRVEEEKSLVVGKEMCEGLRWRREAWECVFIIWTCILHLTSSIGVLVSPIPQEFIHPELEVWWGKTYKMKLVRNPAPAAATPS